MSRDRLLDQIGRELTGWANPADRAWRRFLNADPEAAEISAELEARVRKLARTAHVPPEFVSGWPESERRQLWVMAGDRTCIRLNQQLEIRWMEYLRASDRDYSQIVDREFTPVEINATSYMMFLNRLPSPGESQALTRDQAMNRAMRHARHLYGESATRALRARPDPATDERWLVVLEGSSGTGRVMLLDMGCPAETDLAPDRFDDRDAWMRAFGYEPLTEQSG